MFTTYRVPKCVAEAAWSLHLTLGKVCRAGEAPRIPTEARHIVRRWHTHFANKNSTQHQQNKPTNTNPLFDSKHTS